MEPNISGLCRQTTKTPLIFPTTYCYEAFFQHYNYFKPPNPLQPKHIIVFNTQRSHKTSHDKPQDGHERPRSPNSNRSEKMTLRFLSWPLSAWWCNANCRQRPVPAFRMECCCTWRRLAAKACVQRSMNCLQNYVVKQGHRACGPRAGNVPPARFYGPQDDSEKYKDYE